MHDSIPYDPARKSLLRPESRPVIADFAVDWTLEQICAELSRLAYIRFDEGKAQEEALAEALGKAGFAAPKCLHAEDTNAQGFVTVSADGQGFVVFRGTQADRFRDLLTDLKFWPRTWEDHGRVHRGFLAAYLSLRESLGDALRDLKIAEDRLVVTGHSLGAAMATLMACEFPGATLITFGSPRAGNKAFVAKFRDRDVRRYVDCADFVTRVPPLIYGHVAERRYIDRHGRIHDPPPGRAAVWRDRWAARLSYLVTHAWRFWRNALARSFADHAPINYVSALLGRR